MEWKTLSSVSLFEGVWCFFMTLPGDCRCPDPWLGCIMEDTGWENGSLCAQLQYKVQSCVSPPQGEKHNSELAVHKETLINNVKLMEDTLLRNKPYLLPAVKQKHYVLLLFFPLHCGCIMAAKVAVGSGGVKSERMKKRPKGARMRK